MDKLNNISYIKKCYGCGVCAIICPKQIIQIYINNDGFYQPHIEKEDKCINCGLCLKVCSYTQTGLSVDNDVLYSYAGWSNKPYVRQNSSSGGISFEIARYLIEQDYKAIGVRYNPELNRAEHFIATTVEEFIPSMGSKYIQSYTIDALKQINKSKKYLIIGTPCQIDSINRYLKFLRIEENFILMDFFCHGVPSKLVWDKYFSEIKKIIGKVTYVSWRSKNTNCNNLLNIDNKDEEQGIKVNWHDSYNLFLRGEKFSHSSRYSQGDSFYQLFLCDGCLCEACYDACKYKCRSSAADIRIGDLWGKKYKDNEDGVSGLVVYTKKGNNIIEKIDCTIIPEPFDVVSEGQMKTPAHRSRIYDSLWQLLREEDSTTCQLSEIVKKELKRKLIINRLRHPVRSLINLSKRFYKL